MNISIIVATYNAGNILARCLESIRSQNLELSEFEVIIIDGGSTDNTMEIVETYVDIIGYFESQKDRGIAHAWNKGIEHASGDWILFLGADDYLWSPTAIEQILPFLSSGGQQTWVVYGKVIGVDKAGRVTGELSSKWNRNKFIHYGIYFSHQGVFHNIQLFRELGVFDEDFRYGPDYEFLMRYLLDHDAEYVDTVTVAAMQMGGVSNQPANAYRALGDFRKARRKHGIRGDSLLYYRALVGAWVKRFIYTHTGCCKS